MSSSGGSDQGNHQLNVDGKAVVVESELMLNMGVGGVFALLVIDRFIIMTKWIVSRRNGNNHSSKLSKPLSKVEAMMDADPPRKHTELLEEIVRELRGMNVNMQEIPPLLRKLRQQ